MGASEPSKAFDADAADDLWVAGNDLKQHDAGLRRGAASAPRRRAQTATPSSRPRRRSFRGPLPAYLSFPREVTVCCRIGGPDRFDHSASRCSSMFLHIIQRRVTPCQRRPSNHSMGSAYCSSSRSSGLIRRPTGGPTPQRRPAGEHVATVIMRYLIDAL